MGSIPAGDTDDTRSAICYLRRNTAASAVLPDEECGWRLVVSSLIFEYGTRTGSSHYEPGFFPGGYNYKPDRVMGFLTALQRKKIFRPIKKEPQGSFFLSLWRIIFRPVLPASWCLPQALPFAADQCAREGFPARRHVPFPALILGLG